MRNRLVDAHLSVLYRWAKYLRETNIIASKNAPKVSLSYIRWFIQETIGRSTTIPIDKLGRWVGFIQGVLAANGILDVDKERKLSRPCFEAVYREQELEEYLLQNSLLFQLEFYSK